MRAGHTKEAIMAKEPLTDWLTVEISEAKLDAEGFGEFGSFTVTNTGEWIETYVNTTPGAEEEPPFEFGQLTRFEFKILDLLVDRINQEMIPGPTLVTHVPPPDNLSLVLSNASRRDPLTNSLIRSFDEETNSNPGTYFAYDDYADIVEISALGAFMGYLEHKYGDGYDFIG
jgi:hypothetical protein